MKNIIRRILIPVVAAMSLTACIYEVVPQGGSQTQEQVSASESALKAMIKAFNPAMFCSGAAGYASAYGDHTDFGYPGIALRLEHMLEDIATMADNPYYNRFYAYDMNQGQGSQYTYAAYFWELYYGWIRLANDVISSIKPVVEGEADPDPELRHILGQAYAYRAMCYLDLARLYEPKVNDYTDVRRVLGLTVPIVDENTTIEQTKNNPRVPRADIYTFIFEDLARAEKYIDSSFKTYSEPTLMAVYGMYARAYIELGYSDDPAFPAQESFRKAAEYSRKVIDESGKTPLTQAQWEDPVTGFNNGASNNAWIWGLTTTSENLNNLLTFISHMSGEASWGYARYAQFGVSKRLYDAIPDADWRKHSWLDPEREDYYPYKFAGNEADKDDFLNGMPAARDYQALKFRPAQGECSDFNVGNAGDFCMMRIEEMYFIEAEAMYHLEPAEGVKLLQDFIKDYRYSSYDRISAGADENAFLTELLLQKRIEFWGEGILFYDYKRMDMGITRSYPGSNHAGVYKLNTVGRSPQWNIVVTRREFQNNTAITEDTNNPDPSDKIELQS
ncbi:MAG: RagB/SusD family nutrient uptake outer membrane protein [Bacteroidales bacterium]|nr:RagB/SusD family nutrient uptake outer membrane protein [Bacteroidales bacterium]